METVMHRCGHCNRTLSDPNSMKVGYGPVCYKKLFGVKLDRIKDNTKISNKKTKMLLDLSQSYDIEEVFKDVF
jgi:hypothetical protein